MKKIPFFFFGIVILFCLWLLTLTLFLGYKESFIMLNAIRVPALDTFSLWLTEFGNGFYLTIFALILACTDKKHWKTALNIILCILITTIIVQICKQLLFLNWHRPAKLLQDKPIYTLLNPVPHHNSFPSGHSISVISTATVLSFTLKNHFFELLLGIFVCVIAYTRIYVGAHFPADVAVGSLLGLFTSTGVLYITRSLHLDNLYKKPYGMKVLYLITGLCIIIAIFQLLYG